MAFGVDGSISYYADRSCSGFLGTAHTYNHSIQEWLIKGVESETSSVKILLDAGRLGIGLVLVLPLFCRR
jgi:hypothetical protein